MVDAILPLADFGSGFSFYAWCGTRYARGKFNGNDELVAGPHDTRSKWNTFKEADWGAVDAVVGVPGKPHDFYVFLGGHYFRANIDPTNDLKDSFQYGGIKTIESGWKALVDAGFNTVDAGIPDPSNDDYMFFFSGTMTLKYKWSEDKVTWGPMHITHGWPGLGEAGFDSVDAIFTTAGNDNHTFYVFHGDKWAALKWEGGEDRLHLGPHLIKDSWPSLRDWV